MNVIFITQDEPFYLGKHFNYLFSNLPSWVSVSGIVILEASPFGKGESFLKKLKKTYDVFGTVFFFRYMLRFMDSKLLKRKYLIRNIMRKYHINEICLPQKNINSKESFKKIAIYNPDLIISITANQIFKQDLLKLPKYGCLNLHTAKLPKYKGLMPTFWALKNDEKEIGVSVFIMDKGIDTGDVIVQKDVTIDPSDTLETLINKTKKIGMDSIIEAIF